MDKVRYMDVRRGCLVEGLDAQDPKDAYAALSYVWGFKQELVLTSANERQLFRPGSIKTDHPDLPRTIRDAMKVCEALSITYLWVDSLCIRQDGIDKHDQIRNMHQIYRRAKFTIIAAAGEDANASLPGVIPGSRLGSQPIANARGLKLAFQMRGLVIDLWQSKWDERGWTFQECLLSPRKLIFTPEQVYCLCMHGSLSEDVHEPVHDNARKQQNSRNQFPVTPDMENKWCLQITDRLNWRVYSQLVQDYTRRSLTHDYDILNAFEAILHVSSEVLFRKSPMLFGVPLCSLDIGLLWKSVDTRTKRRKNHVTDRGADKRVPFPSWSWTSVVGPAQFYGTNVTIPRISWLDALDSTTILPIQCTGSPPANWPGWKDWLCEYDGAQIDITYFVPKHEHRHVRYSYPIDDTVWDQSPMHTESGILHLLADVALFKVATETNDMLKKRLEILDLQLDLSARGVRHGFHYIVPEMGYAREKRLEVLDADGALAGTIEPDSSAPEDFSGSYHFIKVSQRTLFTSSLFLDPAWDPKSNSLKGSAGEPYINSKIRLSHIQHRNPQFDESKYDPEICW
jgi:hypothetical protein